MVDFAFDPDDLTVKTYEVPGGVTFVRIYAAGGGSTIAPAIGVRLEQVPVIPGEVLSIDLGGPPSVDGTEGGYGGGGRTGGEGGGGYDDPNGTRGYGGGGGTEIRRGDDSILAVAGGAGGRAGGLSYFEDFYPFVGDTGVPSASTSPRSVNPQPGGGGILEYDIWVPGSAGGEAIGAAGTYQEADVENGTYWGGGGGGGGYGGGSSGGVGFYHYVPTIPPPPEGTFGASLPGRAGGSFIPAEAAGWGIWLGLGAGDGIYTGEGGGFVRIDAVVEGDSGWNVGRVRM